jgi:hypothetical protein
VTGGLGRDQIVQSTEVHVEKEQNWEAGFIPGDQRVEAMLVVKLAGSRCPGTPANARRSKS